MPIVKYTIAFMALIATVLASMSFAGAAPAQLRYSGISVGWGEKNATVGESTSVVAAVKPAVANRLVLLQKATRTGWAPVDRARTDDRGATSFTLTHGQAGRQQYRVYVARDSEFRGAAIRWAYSVTDSSTPPVTPQPPVDEPGVLHGVATGNGDPVKQENALGTNVDVHRSFWQHYQVNNALTRSKNDIAAGRIPFISFKLPYTWKEMAAGKGDAWAKDIATRLDALDGEVWVAFHHEPEKDQPDILDWTAMQKRLAPMFKKDNIEFGLVLTGFHQAFGDGEFHMERIYPFGAPIDFLGYDVYQSYKSAIGDGSASKPSTYYARLASFAKKQGVDWGLAEYGITDGGWADERYNNYFSVLEKDLVTYDAKFATYFDYSQISSWNLSGTKLQAWVRLVKATS